MAQSLFHNYRSALISYNENVRFVGLIEPQRYRGFDVFETLDAANNRFRITHSNPYSSPLSVPQGFGGARKTGVNSPLSLEPLYGVFMSRQGTIIHVDNSIPEIGQFTLTANLTGFTRIDLIVARHTHLLSEGGQPATFFHLTGLAAASPVPPAIIPETDIILGRIIVRAGFTSLASTPDFIRYVPEPLRALGGDEHLSLNRPTQLKTIFAIGEHSTGVTITADGGLDLDGINPTGGIIRVTAHSGVLNRIIYRANLIGTTIRIQNDTAVNLTVINQGAAGVNKSGASGIRDIYTGVGIDTADAPGPSGDDYESLQFLGALTRDIVIRPGESLELQLRAFSGFGDQPSHGTEWVVLGGTYDRMRLEAMALTLINLQNLIADLDSRTSFLEDFGQVPLGKIIFSPNGTVPANYAICDGGTYSIPGEFGGGSVITPDLRNRMLRMGQDPLTEVGTFGGDDTIQITHLPTHVHTISDSGTHAHYMIGASDGDFRDVANNPFASPTTINRPLLQRRGDPSGGNSNEDYWLGVDPVFPEASAGKVSNGGDHNHGGATGDGGFPNSIFRPRNFSGLFIMRIY